MDEVDQLVDYGLERYGLGDVDGALVAWERALAIDPDEVRAAAYVDYVRENYELLAGTPRLSEVDVPFGLGAVPGDGTSETDEGDYEIEISSETPGAEELEAAPVQPAATPIEKYIASVDDGWFLDDEASTPALPLELAPPPLAPPDLGPPERPSSPSRQLPLPAEDQAPPEEQTTERAGAWPRLGDGDFADQRSAVPTQEINTPRGFIRSRLVPLTARPDDTAETTSFDPEDDRLRTRPGRSAGSPLDLSELPRGVAPEALASLTPAPGMRPLGPDESTKESPFVSVSFNPDTQDLTGDDERTQERSALRVDTMSEQTSERRAFTVEPIDGGSPTGAHPPLVIIEDPVLTDFGPPGSPAPPTAEQRPKRPSEPRVKETLEGIGPVGPPMSAEDLAPPTPAHPRRASTLPADAAAPAAATTPSEELAARLEAAIEAAAPPGESRADRTRRRVGELIERALVASNDGDHATAIVALDLALAEDPESAVAQKLVHRHQPAILDCYQRYLGDLTTRPGLAMPMHELSSEKLDIRAAFLLSRIDGALTFEEILDVSGMQRAEAFRHLANLVLRGILTVR